mmetsp:Transcript_10564/g.43682  ORF Transcript_10564/g.43682 Transcript_10564/m.43682 type:complete len:216 (-) Transcript_10564:943-1590(-)
MASHSSHAARGAGASVRVQRSNTFLGVCVASTNSMASTRQPSRRSTWARDASATTSPRRSRRRPCLSRGINAGSVSAPSSSEVSTVAVAAPPFADTPCLCLLAPPRLPFAALSSCRWTCLWQHGAASTSGARQRTPAASASSLAVSHACSASTMSGKPPSSASSDRLVGKASGAGPISPSTKRTLRSHPSSRASALFRSRACRFRSTPTASTSTL